jgi:predicted permease
MRLLARVRSLWRGVFERHRMDAELDAELDACRDELVARHEAAGLAPEAARLAARREMGHPDDLKSRVRESWLVAAWDEALQDVRHAWRAVRATPATSAVAVATFALGIGSVAAILSVVRATLLTPPPYREPSRLVMVWADLAPAGFPRAPLSGPELRDLRHRTSSFEGVGGVWANSITLAQAGEPEFVRIGFVTPDFFPLLGIAPAAGRLLAREDEVEGAPGTILLSHGLWLRRFGGDPGIVGRATTVNGEPAIVVGVLPPGFRLLLPPDAGTPDTIEAYRLFPWPIEEGPRGQRFLRVVGRLKRGTGLVEARQDVDRLAADLARELGDSSPAAFRTVSLEAETTKQVRAPLGVVTAAVLLLMLISAANVLAVLVARAAARRREVALRVALGAGRLRIVRLALAEGASLALLGALAGALVARASLWALVSLQPEALRRLGEARLDWAVVAASLGLALAWGALFALVPLREHGRRGLVATLAVARGETRRLRPLARSTLVVVQVALSTVLLVAAFLLSRSFARLQAVDPGLRADGVLTFRVPSATPRDETGQAREALAARMRSALLSLPGVASVGAASHLPFDSIPNWGGPWSLVEAVNEALPSADYRSVSPGFFETAGVELLSGRSFTERDGPDTEPVAIVDETFAAKAWPSESPLGRRVRTDPTSTGAPTTWVTVVGVVRHVRHRSLVERLNEQVYFPLSQAFRNPVAYLVRTTADPAALGPAVRAAVRGVDPGLPIYELLPLAAYLDRARAVPRFAAALVAAFAGAALVLAAVGVYGVVAYAVVERRREFGVRRALGATRSQIAALVLLEGAKLAGLGVALGLGGALLSGPLLSSLLFGTSATDAAACAAVVPVLALAVLAACTWPVRRATEVPVVEVLRAE